MWRNSPCVVIWSAPNSSSVRISILNLKIFSNVCNDFRAAEVRRSSSTESILFLTFFWILCIKSFWFYDEKLYIGLFIELINFPNDLAIWKKISILVTNLREKLAKTLQQNIHKTLGCFRVQVSSAHTSVKWDAWAATSEFKQQWFFYSEAQAAS